LNIIKDCLQESDNSNSKDGDASDVGNTSSGQDVRVPAFSRHVWVVEEIVWFREINVYV
jgi:hypothetical protein